jgi:hypothetical protein
MEDVTTTKLILGDRLEHLINKGGQKVRQSPKIAMDFQRCVDGCLV